MAITGGPVEVEAGSVLRMAPDAVLAVRDRGALRALGTVDRPITIESAKPAPAAGDWRRIEFYGTSTSANLLRHTHVRHAGDSTYGALWVEAGASLAVESATVTMTSSCALGGEGAVTGGAALTRCAQ
jgi:hypothetical protein